MAFYIILRGPLASGKSTISGLLAKRLNAEIISIDKILDEYRLTKDKEEGYISQKSFIKANEIAFEKNKAIIDSGKTIIFDGNFYWKSQIDDLMNKLGNKCIIFTLKLPVEECIRRDIERGSTHGEAAARVVHKKVTSFEAGINIDASKSKEDIVNEIIKKLNTDAAIGN